MYIKEYFIPYVPTTIRLQPELVQSCKHHKNYKCITAYPNLKLSHDFMALLVVV